MYFITIQRYVNRLVENLKKISSDADKMTSMSKLMVIRREEALTEKRETEPKLELVRRKTKELQKLVCLILNRTKLMISDISVWHHFQPH